MTDIKEVEKQHLGPVGPKLVIENRPTATASRATPREFRDSQKH